MSTDQPDPITSVQWFRRDPGGGTQYERNEPAGGTLNLQPERTATPGEPLPELGCTVDHHGGPCTCTVLDVTPESSPDDAARHLRSIADLASRLARLVAAAVNAQLAAAPATTGEPVHEWFGLSYANYAVQPRTLLQSMPVEWQRRWVELMTEYSDAFAHIEQAPGYNVQPCRWREPRECSGEELVQAGIDWREDGQANTWFWDRDGNQLDPGQACVPVPVTDPVPHYDRGRARVEPRIEAQQMPPTGPHVTRASDPQRAAAQRVREHPELVGGEAIAEPLAEWLDCESRRPDALDRLLPWESPTHYPALDLARAILRDTP